MDYNEEWSKNFLDYSHLKKLLKEGVISNAWTSKDEQTFVTALDENLEKSLTLLNKNSRKSMNSLIFYKMKLPILMHPLILKNLLKNWTVCYLKLKNWKNFNVLILRDF